MISVDVIMLGNSELYKQAHVFDSKWRAAINA